MKKLLNKELGFMAGIVIYLAVLLIDSNKLTPASRAMPVLICVLCLVLIGMKVLLTLLKKGDPTQVEKDASKEEAALQQHGESRPAGFWKDEAVHRTIVFIFWLIAFSLSMYYIGFFITAAVGLMVLFIIISKISVVKSSIITAGTLLFVYLMFISFLNVRFPSGLLF